MTGRRTAFSLAAAALASLLLTAPAFAGTATARFELRVVHEDAAAVAADVPGGLGKLVLDTWEGLAPRSWNDAAHGPYSLVRRSSHVVASGDGAGAVSVELTLSTSQAIPSERASARALATALASAARQAVDRRVGSIVLSRAESLASTLADEQRSVATADAAVVAFVDRWGDVETERETTASRLQATTAALADARVEQAVTAARLEKARRAVQRAAQAAELREELDRLERAAEQSDSEAGTDVLAALREKLRQAEAGSPPLDVARRRVFDLDVELVGLEARIALLEPELHELRARSREIAKARRTLDALERAVESARAREQRADDELHAARRRVRGPFVVVAHLSDSD